MKVLIVAKTRQGGGACIGGITFEGRSVRLIAPDAGFNERVGLEYQVGEVWEVDASPANQTIPPHVENIIVHAKRRLGPMSAPEVFIAAHMPPATGGIESLYQGLTQTTATGALYIAQRTGIPPFSTMFWRPDQALCRDETGKRIRYRYPCPESGSTLTFVGFQEPAETIPAGALVRVSLAHWWRPDNDPEAELRCFVQLSGWFLPQSPGDTAQPARRAPTSANQPPQTAPTPPAHRSDPAARPVEPPNGPTLAKAQALLKTVFGYDAFRPLQAEVIANVLAGRDTLAVMPTGSGKSLCYQLPALLFDGLTVVVSPLISLMHDQVMQLREVGAPAAFLNSTLDHPAYLRTAERVRSGEIKLLYTSPETLLRPETLVLLERAGVACLTIDEAHCISQWGHDFRPEYRQLLPVRRRFPAAVCAAFTATATRRVQDDIRGILGFRSEDIFVASYNRENLFLEVQPRTNGYEQVCALLEAHRGSSGIIYCSTRRQVDALAARLAADGWPALPYHAGLEAEARRHNQDEFSRDRVPIIVATIAFGMGINKSNVRFVLHYNLPESLEHYYQEIGRSGRDGLRADCLLLLSRADLTIRHKQIDDGAESERAGREARLQAMVRYAESTACRRGPLLSYFGEEFTAATCGFCDNCLSAAAETPRIDVSEDARLFLRCVVNTDQTFGPGHIINVLRGSRRAEVLRWRHDQAPEYGTGSTRSAEAWRDLADEFIRQGLVTQDMGHGNLTLTEKGIAVLRGAPVSVAAETPRPVAAEAYDAALFEQLRTLRRKLAEAANVPPFVIFSDRSLAEMAACYPQSPGRFLAIHGVGERKLAQYGDAFLDVIRAYCGERGLQERPAAAPAPVRQPVQPPVVRGSRTEEVGALFAAGYTLEELQALYGVTRGTIVQHLERCVQAGQRFDPERIRALSALSAGEQARVLAALAEHGAAQLRPVFDLFEGTISYDELRIMRCCISEQPQSRRQSG